MPVSRWGVAFINCLKNSNDALFFKQLHLKNCAFKSLRRFCLRNLPFAGEKKIDWQLSRKNVKN
ncbi:MAG: hypothetical protein DBY45_09445 [Clostridiales bacterium]|nr:MAG: hypothetical protein DBY45_09445 [Clostridiales bacterium]